MSYRFLVIQTSFTGDVVLATAVVEKLHAFYPDAQIDFLLRKGNEGLLQHHPYLHRVWVWNKQKDKLKNLWQLIREIRKVSYTHVINLHRFASSGIITWLSKAGYKAGFDKNPFAFCYDKKVTHVISGEKISKPVHETDRNQQLIASITDDIPAWPALYPSPQDYESVTPWQRHPYICIAPASVWFTKQFPVEKWAEWINTLPQNLSIYLLGGQGDQAVAESIIAQTQHQGVVSLCGKLSYLASAALMKGAIMNYVNDSAPLHFATAMQAPVVAVFCSTIPEFGFGPLHANGHIVETLLSLSCRPCGLHGHRACPEGHFKCAYSITSEQLTQWISNRM